MQFFIDGVEFKPQNADSFAIKLDFTKSETTLLEVSTDRMRFELEAYNIIFNHLATIGPFEGIPLDLIVNSTTFNFFVDLEDNLIEGTTFYEGTVKYRNGKDKFNTDAQYVTFERLRSDGIITDSDISETPYVIVKDDQALTLIVLGITTYSLVKAAVEQIRQTADAIAYLVKLAIPDLAGIVPVIKISEFVYYALKVIFELAYTIALFLAIKNMINQIMEIVFPKLRHLKYMKVKRLLECGCQKLGYTFQSTLLDQYFGLSLLPAPHETRQKNIWEYIQNTLTTAFNKGYPTESDSTPTLLGLFKFLEAYLNAETRVINGVVYLEDESYWYGQAAITIANNFNLQAENEDTTIIDTSTAFKRTFLSYARDVMDSNTFDNIHGSAIEKQTDPINVINADLVSIKGLNDGNIPFSLATRKNDFTAVEKVVKTLAHICDALVGSNLESKVNNRIGAMVVSNQFFANSKLMWIVGDRQPANYLDYIGTPALYLARHKQLEVSNYMFRRKENKPVQLTESGFLQLMSNNYAPLETGETVEMLIVDYIPGHVEATASYRYKSNDGFNTKTVDVYAD